MFRLKDLTCLLLNGEWFRCIVLKLLKILIALALTEVTTVVPAEFLLLFLRKSSRLRSPRNSKKFICHFSIRFSLIHWRFEKDTGYKQSMANKSARTEGMKC